MANSLHREIRIGEIVILNPDHVLPAFKKDTRFQCKNGFGLKHWTNGSGIFGMWLSDSEQCKMSGWDIDSRRTDAFQAKFGNGVDPRTPEQQAAWMAECGVTE